MMFFAIGLIRLAGMMLPGNGCRTHVPFTSLAGGRIVDRDLLADAVHQFAEVAVGEFRRGDRQRIRDAACSRDTSRSRT